MIIVEWNVTSFKPYPLLPIPRYLFHGFSKLFTDTSEPIRFVLFSFSVFHFLVFRFVHIVTPGQLVDISITCPSCTFWYLFSSSIIGADFRFEVPGQSSVGLIGGGRGQWLGGTMANAEHEPITGVQGQSPWSGGPLKAFWSLDVQRSRQI